MFPEVPTDLSGLDVASLLSLRAELRSAGRAALSASQVDQAVIEAATGALASIELINAELATREQAQAALSADLDRVAAGFADDDEAAAEEAPATEAAEVAPAAEEAAPAADPVLAARQRVSVPGRFAAPGRSVAPATAPAAEPAAARRVTASQITASTSIAGRQPGDNFGSWTEFAGALMERADNIRGGSGERFTVGQINATYSEDRTLTEDPLWNLRRFEQDELVAQMCAPCEPYYGLACANTDRRPVFNGLPQFAAPRGCVSIYPSPSLSDIEDGTGIWTDADDNDPAARKADCATIECATPQEYRIYGVYRCLEVKNMLQLTYPELVEAYLNRLAAKWARMAEIQLLNQMGTAATPVTGINYGYGASVSLVRNLLTYLSLYQEQQRWDISGQMEVWMHRWVLQAIKLDMISRRTTNGTRLSVPSDAEVISLFRSAGFDPHFFIDTPSWATPVPTSVDTAGALNSLPGTIDMLIAPPGKFALMDRGNLSFGITSNIYRDIDSLKRNCYTFFAESFEGIVNTTSCPAHILSVPTCFNGAQIADLAMDCEGLLA